MKNIHGNIQSLRKGAGLTQEELAEKMNVTRQAISNWETGRTCPDITSLQRLADIFGVEIEYVLYRESSKNTLVRDVSGYKKASALFGALLLCLVISYSVLTPSLTEAYKYAYSFTGVIVTFIIRQLSFISGTIFGLSLFSIFKDISIPQGKLKTAFLVTGAAVTAVGVMFVPLIYFFPWLFSSLNRILLPVINILLDGKLIVVISSILLYLGINSPKYYGAEK